ncbi:unnamed protein product [Hyaloperonospora brassicae]|uniref:CCHC-type domain-containing protein n=1 Tax=Hyaloperonospora brassicae TaxID=162125 RepID=A0AAV0TA01_HYABA|nr:unnamed protein product [Hyaloperonospora brassicae]
MLPYAYTTNDVAQLFVPFGTLARVLVLRDQHTQRSRGVAFVQFARARDCRRAVAAMDKQRVGGLALSVSLSRDNGRADEFKTKRTYATAARCFECGDAGHVSYECPRNVLGARERPVAKSTGHKRSRTRLERKRESGTLGRRGLEHWVNAREVTNMLAPSTDSDEADLSISLLAYPPAAPLSSSASSYKTAPAAAAAVAMGARRRPQRKPDSYFSDEDASGTE